MTNKAKAGRRVIVLNPDPCQSEEVKHLLCGAGFSVRRAAFRCVQGFAAVDEAASLIISSLHMPGIDGWRLCRLLRTSEYAVLNAVPVLMVAETYTPEEAKTIAADFGVDAYLSWPEDKQRLVQTADTLLRGETVRPKLRALVVEDDSGMSELIKRSLLRQKFDVTRVDTARSAEQALSGSAFDLAVIDYHLPDRSGSELLKTLIAHQPDCACIMITGDFTPGLAAEWMRRGAAAYLRKPFQMEYLLEVCARARRERALLRAETLLQKRSKKLQESELKYRELIDQAADMIFLHDLDGSMVDVNRSACVQTGYSREELLKMRVFDLDPDAEDRGDREKHWKADSDVFVSKVLTVRHKRKDGTIYPAEVALSPVRFGNRNFILGVGRDITERLNAERERQRLATNAEQARLALRGAVADQKRTEEALDRERDILRTVLDNLPDGVCLKDGKLILRLANREYTRFLGVSSEADALGKTDADFFPSDTAAELVEADRSVLNNKEALLNREETLPYPDGTPREMMVSRLPVFGPQKQVTGVLSIFHDITAHKELEYQIQQAQKMESIGRLAGGIAHDFNNMLQSIFGNADLALEEAGPDSPVHEDLIAIRNAARRSSELTGKLLAFARRQSMALETLDLNEAIGQTLPLLGRMIGENIELEFKKTEGLWPVRMDPSQLDQVLTNLAINARDAISGNGKFSIKMENFSVDEAFCEMHLDTQPGDYVRIQFSDTGSGMTREVQSHIFEPFYTTKEKGKGTGLGLSTVYGIIRKNGGFVYVYSEPGMGSTFQLFIPRTQEQTRDPLKADSDPLRGGTETVLVVEDEVAILKLNQRILTNYGYTALAVPSPGEALALVEKKNPPIDLLLTDVIMPVMNGRELADKVREIRPDIEVLYMSGYTADVLDKECALEKENGFLAKPFSSRTLAARVRQALDEHKEAGQSE